MFIFAYVYLDQLKLCVDGLGYIYVCECYVTLDECDEPLPWLQTTQPTSGGAVTVVSSCCANCVEPPRPQQWGPDLPFLGMPAMRTRWMAGAAAHKSG